MPATHACIPVVPTPPRLQGGAGHGRAPVRAAPRCAAGTAPALSRAAPAAAAPAGAHTLSAGPAPRGTRAPVLAPARQGPDAWIAHAPATRPSRVKAPPQERSLLISCATRGLPPLCAGLPPPLQYNICRGFATSSMLSVGSWRTYGRLAPVLARRLGTGVGLPPVPAILHGHPCKTL